MKAERMAFIETKNSTFSKLIELQRPDGLALHRIRRLKQVLGIRLNFEGRLHENCENSLEPTLL